MSLIRQARKAKKILTEFDLKGYEKLRIYVYFWGDVEYAKKLGYRGNTVYIPVLVDNKGHQKKVYKGEKGVPTLKELDEFYDCWKNHLANWSDKERLKIVQETLRELAQTNIYFDERQAHAIYHYLRIARGGPTFRITDPSDSENLSINIEPTIMVSFKGNVSYKPIIGLTMGTRLVTIAKIIKSYSNELETIEKNLQEDLAMFAGPEGPVINLDVLASYVNEKMQAVFDEEGRSKH